MVNSAVFVFTPSKNHPQVVEVDFALSGRLVGLRDVPQLQRPARFSQNLRAPLADMITHRRIRQPLCAMLIDQAGQDPPRSMTLLLRRIQITAQHGIDRRLERLQPRRYPRSGLAGRRHRRGQRLTHRAPMHPVLVGQPPNREPLDPVITPDRLELLHPRHPSHA